MQAAGCRSFLARLCHCCHCSVGHDKGIGLSWQFQTWKNALVLWELQIWDKQTGSTSLTYSFIQKRSSRGGVTLSRAQPALPLLTAQQSCLWAQIPVLSSPEAVKMYFLLCHSSSWQAGSQGSLESIKVGNKVIHWEKKKEKKGKWERGKGKKTQAQVQQ